LILDKNCPKGWLYKTVEDVSTKVTSGGTPSRKKSDYYSITGYCWVKTKELENKYIYDTEEKISEIGLRKSSAKLLPKNTLLVAMYGATVGKLGMTSKEMTCNQACCAIVTNPIECIPLFLFYKFLNSSKKLEMLSIGAAQQNLSGQFIKEIQFSFPNISNQESIVAVLSNLDSKIELNQKMNETLEEIAKTLFKSWFIDFDPVRAKAEGRPTGLSKEISDLFPDSFEDSELGQIPKGWKLSNLDSNLEFVLGGDWGKEEHIEDFNKEVVCIRGADIPNLQTFVKSNPPKRFIKESSLEKRKLKEGDLVLEISGGSPTQSTGRIVYITKEFLSTQDCPVVFSNFCRILRSDLTLSKYIYYYLRCLYDSDKLFQYETGTTGIKNFGYKHFSKEVFFALPNFDLLKIFSELIESFLTKKGTNLREIITLTNLRDILLPKLISGELKISDAESLIKEAGI
jgi:type I restriction enzyme, S subunit